jgi:hypothetical protein
MLVRSSFGLQRIRRETAVFLGKSVLSGLGLPRASPAGSQPYPRNSGFQGPGIGVASWLGRPGEAVSRASRGPPRKHPGTPGIAVPATSRNSGFQGSRIAGLAGLPDLPNQLGERFPRIPGNAEFLHFLEMQELPGLAVFGNSSVLTKLPKPLNRGFQGISPETAIPALEPLFLG